MKYIQEISDWFKKKGTHRGKTTLIPTLIDELEIEDWWWWNYHGIKQIKHNNDIAVALNELVHQKKIETSVDGKAYSYTWIGELSN